MVLIRIFVFSLYNYGVVMIKKKHRVLETVTTVDGTLYKDEVVTFENEEADGDWRVKDNMGRIWYVNPNKLTKSPIQLSRSKQ